MWNSENQYLCGIARVLYFLTLTPFHSNILQITHCPHFTTANIVTQADSPALAVHFYMV